MIISFVKVIESDPFQYVVSILWKTIEYFGLLCCGLLMCFIGTQENKSKLKINIISGVFIA